MKVSELMAREVQITRPDDSVRDAAQMMARIDAGILPVGEQDRLVGMITDRDIAIRAVGAGRDPSSTRVSEVMTREVKYCYDDDDVADVAENMAQLQVRRLPVVSHEKRLVGIISLGDIARGHEPRGTGEALRGVARRGGQHTQGASGPARTGGSAAQPVGRAP